MVRVLFVCLGNICRSPTAHGVFRDLIEARGYQDRVAVDSCGTANYHVGESPHNQTMATATQHGTDLSDLVARQLRPQDFADFDLLVAMDQQNQRDIEAIRPAGSQTPVVLFMDFVPEATELDVLDPYYRGQAGFEEVYQLAQAGCAPLLEHALSLA